MMADFLQIDGLHAGYGETIILRDISFRLAQGEVLTILGRNGVGKSTLLKSIIGLLPIAQGQVNYDGRRINHLPPYQLASIGIAYVPETRDIFPSLSVRENLEIAQNLNQKLSQASQETTWDVEKVIALFPWLGERMHHGGTELSGGEQQMLAIARALLMNPRLLILDEPTEGLAPIIVAQLQEILSTLKQQGLTMLLVEQNFHFATKLADQAIILGQSQIKWQGDCQTLLRQQKIQMEWLGI